MRTYGYSHTKKVLCLFFLGFLAVLGVTQGIAQSADFSILRLLKNETDESVLALEVQGSFLQNDVLNVYTNDQFIKSKVIGASDAGDDAIVMVKNISVDVLRGGVNDITAAIERQGVEAQRTQPFQVTIHTVPDRPVVAVVEAEEDDGFSANITGSFLRDDIVAVFLNGEEVVTVPVTDNLVEDGSVSVILERSSFHEGDNRVEALIRRGDLKSGLSSREVVTIATEEKQAVAVQERLPVCFSYEEQQQIQPRYRGRGNEFGTMVSVFDNTVAVGDNAGKAEIFTMIVRDDEERVWEHVTRLSGGRYTFQHANAKSTVLDGSERLFVGTDLASFQGDQTGLVEVFTRSETGDGWSGTDLIAPQPTSAREQFGRHIAVNDTRMVVSALRPEVGGGIYVYDRKSRSEPWDQVTFITPRSVTPAMRFGERVAIAGDRIAVLSPGNFSVYVYTKEGGRWIEERVAVPQEGESLSGVRVLLTGDFLIVGVPDGGVSGEVFIYERNDRGRFILAKVLPAPDGVQAFGAEIAYEDGVLAVGAPRTKRVGAVLVFTHRDGIWRLQDIVAPSPLRPGDRFGTGIAMQGTTLVVGAPGDDATESTNVGTAYVFAARESVCSATVVGKDMSEQEQRSPEENVRSLRMQREELEILSEDIQSLLGAISQNIVASLQESAQQQERIIIFDEALVDGSAQRRAATVRGLAGPLIPPEVTVEQYEAKNASIPKPEVRSNVEVVDEIINEAGIVVPVANTAFALGDQHEDVYRLQIFLNQNGFSIAESGPGSPGNETNTFTKEVESALKLFQLVNGLEQTGVLDSKTRDFVFTYVDGA